MLVASALKALIAEERTVSESRFYRPELDGLRFVAFLAVFLFHASNFATGLTSTERALASCGKFGVCLFFVLSSYLITELLLREKRKTGTIHIRSFYIRRVLRIWPLYFGFLALCFVIGLFHKTWHMPGAAVAAFSFLAGNWYMIYSGDISPLAAPLWSISLEEQFYLIWPTLAKLGGRRGLTFAALAVLPLAAGATLLARGDTWYNSLVQFQFFGIGALLALRLNGRTPQLGAYVRIGLWFIGLSFWIAGGYYSYSTNETFPLLSCECAAAGCLCLMLGTLGAPARWFPGRVLKLGQASYGLYVFHLLALLICHGALKWMSGLTLLVSFLLTVILALASYRWLEMPFLRFKERFTYVLSRTA